MVIGVSVQAATVEVEGSGEDVQPGAVVHAPGPLNKKPSKSSLGSGERGGSNGGGNNGGGGWIARARSLTTILRRKSKPQLTEITPTTPPHSLEPFSSLSRAIMALVYGRYNRDSLALRAHQQQSHTQAAEENIKLCMDLVIDLTALNVEFDYSCLEGLDEQLILRPFESFADVCYTDAVYDLPPDAKHFVPPHLQDCHLEYDGDEPLHDNNAASPESDSDGVSLTTSQGSDVYTFDSRSKVDYEVVKLERPPQKLSLVQLHHLIHIDDDGESFLQFRDRYLKMNGLIDEPVSSFPVREPRRRTFGDRIHTNFEPSRQPYRALRSAT
ncbi:hypothetical protein V5O48_002404 [Marasmius crinis-equi]|uniref:Uncharacterized protein n=1 Tax=Marasmius crinis-equi TaxID=585013 RepID=A0ABR3FWK6_9AGAR